MADPGVGVPPRSIRAPVGAAGMSGCCPAPSGAARGSGCAGLGISRPTVHTGALGAALKALTTWDVTSWGEAGLLSKPSCCSNIRKQSIGGARMNSKYGQLSPRCSVPAPRDILLVCCQAVHQPTRTPERAPATPGGRGKASQFKTRAHLIRTQP